MAHEVIVRNGNSKLGKGIGKVSLPAVITCPGRGDCEQFCYAAKLMMRFPAYNQSIETHRQILEGNPEGYKVTVIADIQKAGYEVVRVHESGDFYSLEQINLWHQIAVALPEVTFYAYTRSWTQVELKPHLESLAALANFSVRASVEPGETPPEGWAYTTVVAKDHTERPDGGIICHEQTGKKASCIECGVCWKSQAPVLFQMH